MNLNPISGHLYLHLPKFCCDPSINHLPQRFKTQWYLYRLHEKLNPEGVKWSPQPNDFFAIPDRELDERVFVISEMMTNIEQIRGRPMVSFHGSAEWATDYLVTSEVVWLPRESQIRDLLTKLIGIRTTENGANEAIVEAIHLHVSPELCICSIKIKGNIHQFKALHAADAYALAFLYLSEHDHK